MASRQLQFEALLHILSPFGCEHGEIGTFFHSGLCRFGRPVSVLLVTVFPSGCRTWTGVWGLGELLSENRLRRCLGSALTHGKPRVGHAAGLQRARRPRVTAPPGPAVCVSDGPVPRAEGAPALSLLVRGPRSQGSRPSRAAQIKAGKKTANGEVGAS